MDFDTDVKYARLITPQQPPAAAAAAERPAAANADAPAGEPAAAAAAVETEADALAELTGAAASMTSAAALESSAAASSSSQSSSSSDVANNAAAGKLPQHTQANKKATKASKKPSGTRNFHTGRATLLPVFPTPSAEFLAARAPMPVFGQKGRPVISVAPMVDVTDRHYRYMFRLISRHTLLYTPMIVDNALQRAPHAATLYTDHQAMEHPLVAQLGGNEAASMARAAKICEAQGFQAININVGCPAPSAIGHAYGACLMSDPDFHLVCRAMVDAVKIPVSVKCRIGLNKEESWEFFEAFIQRCYEQGGIRHFIIHARKALLNLKSAGKNLTVPPLNYDFVYRLKKEYPDCVVELNGGVESLEAAAVHVEKGGVDGVMFGRLAWKQPYLFSGVDQKFYGSTEQPLTRLEVVEKYLAYVEKEWEKNVKEIAEFEARHAAAIAEATAEAKRDPAAAVAKAVAALNKQAPPVQQQQQQEHGSEEAKEQQVQPPLPSLHQQPQQNHSELVAAAVAADAAVSAAQAAGIPMPGLRHGDTYLSRFAPHQLDPRQLLRPLGYLYTHEPGYRRFRLLFEEGLLRHKDWPLRHIVERAMAAVEPPPPREWGPKDSGYEYSAAAKAEMDAARLALAQGGAAAAARAHAQGKTHALDFINGGLESAKGASAPGASIVAAAVAASASASSASVSKLSAAEVESLSAQLAASTLSATDGEAQCSAAAAAKSASAAAAP
jgi:tRNA-dihydrouridine synthase A